MGIYRGTDWLEIVDFMAMYADVLDKAILYKKQTTGFVEKD